MSLSTVMKGGLAALVLLVAGGAALYFFVIKSDPPPPVSLADAVAGLATPTPGAARTAVSPTATGGSLSTGTAGGLSGQWTITGTNSFVGYRVVETLASIGANTAVGRTSAITGTLTYDGNAITALEVTADLRNLRSDNNLRDGQLRTQAIQTNTFPNATFKLASPIEIGSAPADGQSVKKTVTGDLTLHGVTRRISIDVEGTLRNGQVVVVGSTEVLFADYNIGQPRGASVVSIENKGVMELQLVFTKAAG